MTSCGSTNIGTKLSESKNSGKGEKISNDHEGQENKEDNEKLKKLNSGEFIKTRSTYFICHRNSNNCSTDHNFSRFKSRSTGEPRNEFRMARGGISGERGQGGGYGGGTRSKNYKKTLVDRESNSDGSSYTRSTTRPKFQESLKNQENKFYDGKRNNEDSRISKLIRRLSREDDYDHFLGTCKQLQESILAPDNQRYIRRNLELICDNILDIMHNGPSLEAKLQVAKSLGRIGYVSDQDFRRFMDFLFSRYNAEESKDDVKCLLMKAFSETLKLDAESPKLKNFSMGIMTSLQTILGNIVDNPDLLMNTVDCILLMVESYPSSFTNHFRDAVDILVGWHIDPTQQKTIVAYARRSLQKLRSYWVSDLQFTLNLLGNFLEDMESYDVELSLPGSGRSSPGDGDAISCPRDCVLRITSLIAVFNTVMRCIGEHLNPNQSPSVEWPFLTDCLTKMLTTVIKAIELDDGPEILGNNDNGLSQENSDSIIQSMKNMKLSQKSIDALLKSLNRDDELYEENLMKLIKSLNPKKNDKKNSKISDKDYNSTLTKEKEESLIHLLRSMDLKIKKNSDISVEKEELIVVANECTFLLLGHLQSRVSKNHDLLYRFIDLQLQRIGIFWDYTIVSMLNTISKVIKEVSANLPLDLVHTLLGKNSAITKLRFRNSIPIQNGVLGVYHSLLSLKNIPLLQEAYRYILADLENAYKIIIPLDEPLVNDNPFTELRYQRKHAEIVLIFLLRALSDIANASNSIIGMWALKPSILELLAIKLKPQDPLLSEESPLLQYHILFLLYTHCSRYNHFVPSSSLITGTTTCRPLDIFPCSLEVPTVSPTSGHLSIILNLIAGTIENKNAPVQTLLLLLDWLHEIYTQAENYIGVLSKTEECQMVGASLLVCGATTNYKVALAVCKNLKCLLKTKQIGWPDEVYVNIVDLVTLHLTSFDETVREKYGKLLMNVPLNIVIPKLNKAGLLSDNKKLKDIKNYSSESLILSQRLHMRNNNVEMLPQHFKNIMAFLLQEFFFDVNALSEMFTLSWPTISDNATMSKMHQLGLVNRSFLFFWAGFEAAQYCIHNKLRTCLGKPQETFTSIEAALKTLAREISCTSEESNKKEKRGLDSLLKEHTRVRLLIEFLEHLERVIHNAADGCAVALLPCSKPVRTFFHTNKSTCREWLNRIRLALCVVSLHAGLATNALRNGQRLLEDLSAANNIQGVEFERAMLCTARALVMLGEPDAIRGLYKYSISVDRKLKWLEPAEKQASGKYESAAENYHRIIDEHLTLYSDDDTKSENRSKNECGDPQVTVFCMEQLSKCYHSVDNWSQLEAWKTQESEILLNEKYSNLRKQMPENITISQVTCLHKFSEAEEVTLKELSDWTLLDEEIKTNWSCAKTMIECSNTLTNVALKITLNEVDKASFYEDVQRCKKVAARTMEESLRNIPSEYLNEAILVQYAAAGLEDVLNGGTGEKNPFELFEVDKFNQLDSSVLTQILWWSDYFQRTSKNITASEVQTLRLHVAYAARKEGNFSLAQRELGKYFTSQSGFKFYSSSFMDIVQEMINGQHEINWSKDNTRAFRETSKLLYSMDKISKALKVCSVTALGISKSIVAAGENAMPELRELGTRALLTLGKWIQRDVNERAEVISHLDELLLFESQHNDGLMDKFFGKTTELIPISDMIVGKLVHLGVNQCPDLPAAWSNFATWCYKWGRKIVDNSSFGLLTDTDKLKIESLLPMDTTEEDLNAVLAILGQKNRVVLEDEGDIDTSDLNTSDTIEDNLRNVPILNCASDEHLGLLVDVWRQAQTRIYSYYELSANAYFKYLQLASLGANDCETISATLRLLRLVVKHASELQNVLEAGLSTTPTGPWKEIIPQLFSRLSHPEYYVRARVSELLCRVAENSPHLITFPAVVGAVSCGQKRMNSRFDRDNCDEENEMEYFIGKEEYGIEGKDFMEECFAQLTDCLANRIPQSVDQVKILVRELRRITLLWDELWLATLCQHHSDITKRFEQLELEVQKVQDNIWLCAEEKDRLIAEKHRIILKPIIFILENLTAMTMVTPETPHEKHFQEKFGPCIEKVIEKLKNPANPARPQEAAQPLKQLEAKLAQKVHKRNAYNLQMSDISPTLAKFKDTCIAMPGVCTTKMVTIRSVDNSVQILPTKTKPKKLMFRGSDGHVYTYLFKGLEDLHLDERIMQFLSICNTMMLKNNDNEAKKVYRARHYSVIPLGPRSGLIQWVDGVTPLFALYKRWQQRESAMNNKTGNSAIMRPSELFYSKLTPLLKERGIATENRKEWPLAVLKQVLAELMAETPKDLLAKEIWCNSINAGSWWQATKNYSYSVAVMSIIGYIIGLGDRHLDNVLVDLNTGEVVHIDYNVCFEKGKTLRVPEKVPFRMTPNIKTALGVSGVEGIFREACEQTLRIMRRGRETLLTLLEAFVYDPLVDWRAGADNSIATYGACQARARCTGIGRKQLESELTMAMFAVRIAEMRAEWLANKDELEKNFPALCHRLNRWIEASESSRLCQDSLQDRHRQLALVKEAQAMGRSHALYSLVKRYNGFKRAKDVLEKAKLSLTERIEECQKQITTHNISLSTVRGPQLNLWLSELNSSNIQEDYLVFDLVKEFLQNAGQSQMIVQCEQSENELTQLVGQQSMLVGRCLDGLNTYANICSMYPLSSMAYHRSVLYHTWANKLMMTANVDTCREVLAEMELNFAPVAINDARVQRTVSYSYRLQAILRDAQEKCQKAYNRFVMECSQESLNKVEKAYVDAQTQINNFLKRDKGADKALECVNITALCTLNKKYLMMEGAAKCAGDCLVDLTSREGDWFLDEMRLMSSLMTEFISWIPENHKTSNDSQISLVMKCLKNADAIHKGLQELNFNFQTIILPEATKTIITEERTVLRMINELEEIIASTGISLMEILEQLEIHLRYTVLEMESPSLIIQPVVDALRQRFENLLSRPADLQELNQEETLTPGQMLLMGFNGLFEKLQMEGNALIVTLQSLDIPSSWKKIDQIKEAKEMSAPIFNEAARKVLDDIFLVKRLYTIQKFFSMCRDIAFAFRADPSTLYDTNNTNIYSDEELNKPIRLFTADYVSRQLLGVTSQSLGIALCFLLQRMGVNVTSEIEQRDVGAESKVQLEDLCRKLQILGQKKGYFNNSVLTQASAVSTALESSWRKKQSLKAIQQNMEVTRSTAQRLLLQLNAHYWLHEDYLKMGPAINLDGIIYRDTFLGDLRNTVLFLAGFQARVNEAREQQQNLVTSAVQRLKWAAGANPALSEVMAAFDNAVITSCEKLTRQANLASLVVNICNNILHFEALRTRTVEGMSNDTNFIKLVKHWEDSCSLTSNLTINVTPVEESLVEILQITAENSIDANWLRQIEKIISDAIVEAQKKTQERQEAFIVAQQSLREQVGFLQATVADHHKLMNDVRLLLRSMAKQENIPGLLEFLANYRSCTESLSNTVKELESENLEPGRAVELKMELEMLAVKTPGLYDELLSFEKMATTEKSICSSNKGKLVRQDSICLSPRKGVPQPRDPTTGKAVQERNAYALNVWRRVRMKLEGREPQPTRRYSINDQVEYVIREAQNIDNLALLYEGWTPWV